MAYLELKGILGSKGQFGGFYFVEFQILVLILFAVKQKIIIIIRNVPHGIIGGILEAGKVLLLTPELWVPRSVISH